MFTFLKVVIIGLWDSFMAHQVNPYFNIDSIFNDWWAIGGGEDFGSIEITRVEYDERFTTIYIYDSC